MRSQLNTFEWKVRSEAVHTVVESLLGGKGKPQVDAL